MVKISVIIPTFGTRSEFIIRAINSCLNQTISFQIEVIIVDDNGFGSNQQKSNELLILKNYQDIDKLSYLVNSKNQGGSYSRNKGVNKAQGKFICFLDDDDEFEMCKLENQLNFLEQNPRFQSCYTQYAFYLKGKRIKTYRPKSFGNLTLELLCFKNSICAGSTLMIDRAIFNSLGGFDISFRRYQDWEFLLRFFDSGYQIGVVNKVLTRINRDSRINEGKYADFVRNKYYFLQQFNDLIQKNKKKRTILMYQYMDLCKNAIRNRQFKDAISFYTSANKNRFIGLKQHLLVLKAFTDGL